MRLQDYDTSKRFTATVVATEPITPEDAPIEVREIVLDIAGGDFDAAAGQNIGVLAPGQEAFGQENHFRLYSAADLPTRRPDGATRLPICVKRCTYVDDYNGEVYQGVASNYLCDLREGDTLTITGPHGQAFQAPDDPEATLILIGAGTGIAPFRAFLKSLFREASDYKGRVLLFHGGRTGMELLYMNDARNDFSQYYDRETFEAIEAFSPRPHWSDAIDWHGAMEERAGELWERLQDAHTRVYLAGLESIRDELDSVFAKIAGSPEKWERRKAELTAGKRWVELLY